MSWRILFRVASLLLAGRTMARQRRARSGSAGPPRPTLPGQLARRLSAVRRDAGIAARIFTLGVFLAASGVLATAGTSSAVLTPRWLGVVLLTLAAAAGVAAFLEARGLRRAIVLRRLQRRDEAVRREL
jgi:hypothetical protein